MIVRRPLFALAFFSFVTTGALAACGGSTTGSAAPVAEADFVTQASHAICDNIKNCCGQATFMYDQTACLTALQTELQSELADMKTGTTYDAIAAGNCVAAFAQTAAACAEVKDTSTTNEACKNVYAGTKKPGESCDEGNQCATSTDGEVSCEHFGSSTIGADGGVVSDKGTSQCVVFKKPAKGDHCGFSDGATHPSVVGDCEDPITSTFYCEAKTSTCQPRIAVGQACDTNNYNACVLGSSCTNGTCSPVAVEGSACQDLCSTGFYCARTKDSSGAGTCAKQKKAGDACGDGELECESGDCTDGKCSAGTYATAAICAGKSTKGSSSTGSAGTADGG